MNGINSARELLFCSVKMKVVAKSLQDFLSQCSRVPKTVYV